MSNNKLAKILAYCYQGRPWLKRTGDEVRIAGVIETLSEICCTSLDVYCQGEIYQVYSSGRVTYRELPSSLITSPYKRRKRCASSCSGLIYDNPFKVIMHSLIFLVKNYRIFKNRHVILTHGPSNIAPIIVRLLKLISLLGKNVFLIFDPQANCAQTLYLKLTQSRGISRLGNLLSLGAFILLQKLQFASSDAIMFPSGFDAYSAMRIYKLPERKVHVIPTISSVTYEDDQEYLRLREVYRAKLNLTEEDVALIYTAGSKVEANQVVLTRLSQLTKLFSREDLCLIVTGPWKDLAHQFKAKRVLFTGTVNCEELAGLLAAADIGLSPIMIGAGMSTKTLDYLVAGLIIVATPLVLKGIEPYLKYAQELDQFFVVSSYDELERKLTDAVERIKYFRGSMGRQIITCTLAKQIMQRYFSDIAKAIVKAVASYVSS